MEFLKKFWRFHRSPSKWGGIEAEGSVPPSLGICCGRSFNDDYDGLEGAIDYG